MPGKLYIVATPIGNLEDMTHRAIRILGEVDFVAAEDTRHTKKLFAHFDIHTRLISFFKGNENCKAGSIIEILKTDRDVALVSDGGTPCISDPGYPLLKLAIEEGIEVVPVPGPSAVATALSAAGLATDRFTFIGFLPDKPGKRIKALEQLKEIGPTLVFYVSPYKIVKTLCDCRAILGDRQACLCREMTKLYEEFMRGTLSEIAARFEKIPPRGEMVLVVSGKSYS
jgi:16S rRNA (cytidine1402-2'-O)-methyltransferase